MTKNIRIGIIRARHDTNVPVIPDQACIAMMMTGDYALLRYWINTTRGYLDFLDSSLFPWVDITLGADTGRGAQATAAINAIRARFPDRDPLAGLDGLVVLSHPGRRTMTNPLAGKPGQPATIMKNFDGGKTEVGEFRVAVLPTMSSDHTFMCHELGHVLGFEHSFGLDNNGTDWNPADANIIVGPEYGSPYDLMSSASFGSRWLGTGPLYSASPTFVGPPVSGWPNANGALSMGPHLSRANLHRFMPDALDGRVVDRQFPAVGGTVRVRLVPTSASSGKSLLILRPPNEPANGVGRVYIEYRVAQGWDAGMDILGPGLSREGVVVHSIVDQQVGPRIWYRGSIPTVSVDTDVAIATTPLVVRVEDIDPDRTWVEVAITTGAERRVEITRGNHSDDVVGVVGALEQTTTPCGDTIRKGTFATSTFCQFSIRTTGFGGGGEPNVPGATVAWTVGGVAMTGNSGTVNVPYDGVTFAVEYTIDPVVFELALTSRGGERFEVPVVVTVTGDGTTATSSTIFVAIGWIVGIHPDDVDDVARCLRGILERYRDRVPPIFRKPTPEPEWSLKVRDEVQRLWYGQVTQLINQTVTLDAAGQTAFRQLVSLQVQSNQILIGALAAVGIDYSVSEADITDWLTNPEFTPYPALAEALLTRLGGNRLRHPVYLDVIAFNYEQTRGVTSPRTVDSVRIGVLEAAVLKGSNKRHGKRTTSFADLLAAPDSDNGLTRTRADVDGEVWRMGRVRLGDPG